MKILPGNLRLQGGTDKQKKGIATSNYVVQVRDLLKNSGIYALSSIISPLVTLVLSPFLAHHLSRTEYGALAVLLTTIALVAGIAQLGLGSAFFRSYNYDYESPQDRQAVLSMVVLLLLITSLLTLFAMLLLAPWLSMFLLQSSSEGDAIRIAALVILLQNLTIPGFAWLRAENRATFFVVLSIANLLITLVATIVLVGGMHKGIIGSLFAIGAGYAFIVLCTLPAIFKRAGVHLRRDIAWGLLSFGLPNVFNFLAMWVLQLSDRFLLARLGSLEQTASYAVAYSLGSAISVVVLAPFSLAWPSFAFTIARRDDASHVFQTVFRWYSLFLLFTTFALSFVGIAVLDIFFPPSYHASAPIIPIIALSIMLFGIYTFVGFGIGLRRKNWLAVVFTTLAALVNVVANLLLIPSYGAIGAAVATLIAYIVLVVICYNVTQRIYPVPFEIGIFITALLIGTVLYGSSSILGWRSNLYEAWGISLGALILYGTGLVLLGVYATRRDNQRFRALKKEGVA